MNIKVEQGGIQEVEADAIIVNLFEGVTAPGGATGAVDRALSGAISELIEGGDLSGKLGQVVVLYPRGAIPARRVIVVGLGKAVDFELEAVREAAGAAIKRARQLGAAQVATIIHGGGIGGLDVAEAAQAVVEASLLALYKYDAPRSVNEDEEENRQVESLALVEFDQEKIDQLEAGAEAGQAIAEGTALARTLANWPGNLATPLAIAEAAETMCAQMGLEYRVLDEEEMRQEEMNLLLAVTQGATEPACFIIMEHKPEGAKAGGPLVLVGKGVAFDTGGYSLKPTSSMLGMKADMAGAAAVIGAMQAIARLQVPLHVIGLLPTVENVVGPTAYKPGDVFIGKNGVSVEVVNTDAEGRLILADALAYAGKLNPAAVVDVATLTGGKVIALGNRTNGLFYTEDRLGQALLAAGQRVGEPLWRLPLDKAYDRQLKSEVADIKNIGGREASAITAARFLAYFVADWPWAHIDMAGGESYSNGPEDTPRSYMTKGATGSPVRTLVEFIRRGDFLSAE